MNKTILILSVVALTISVADAQVYTITDLGAFSPTAINDWGEVAGNSESRAYLWDASTGWQDLGSIPGGAFSQASAISDAGVVVGVAEGAGTILFSDPLLPSSFECGDFFQPFVWTRSAGMSGLPVLAYPIVGYPRCLPFYYYASDVNIFGEVIGGSHDEGTYEWGFTWTASESTQWLATGYTTEANGINNFGQVAGQRTEHIFLPYLSEAALWDKGLETRLGTLGGGPASLEQCSAANAINDSGQIVGWSTADPGNCIEQNFSSPVHAFLWDRYHGMRDLGTLPGDVSAVATHLNLLGQVIGSSGNSQTYDGNEKLVVYGRPFIWTESQGMRDLNDLLSHNRTWVLKTATGINIRGQIVGVGEYGGEQHGYLLTPRPGNENSTAMPH